MRHRKAKKVRKTKKTPDICDIFPTDFKQEEWYQKKIQEYYSTGKQEILDEILTNTFSWVKNITYAKVGPHSNVARLDDVFNVVCWRLCFHLQRKNYDPTKGSFYNYIRMNTNSAIGNCYKTIYTNKETTMRNATTLNPGDFDGNILDYGDSCLGHFSTNPEQEFIERNESVREVLVDMLSVLSTPELLVFLMYLGGGSYAGMAVDAKEFIQKHKEEYPAMEKLLVKNLNEKAVDNGLTRIKRKLKDHGFTKDMLG